MRIDSLPDYGFFRFALLSYSVVLRLQFVLSSASFRSLARESGAPKLGDRYHSPHDDEITSLSNSGPCQGNLIDFVPCYKAQHKHFFARVSMTGTSRHDFCSCPTSNQFIAQGSSGCQTLNPILPDLGSGNNRKGLEWALRHAFKKNMLRFLLSIWRY